MADSPDTTVTGFNDPDIKQAGGFDGISAGQDFEQGLRFLLTQRPVSLDNWRQWRYFTMIMKMPFIELESRIKMCEETANRKFMEDISRRPDVRI